MEIPEDTLLFRIGTDVRVYHFLLILLSLSLIALVHVSIRRSFLLLLDNPVPLHYLHFFHATMSTVALGLLTLHHLFTPYSPSSVACAPVAAIIITSLGLTSLSSFLILFIKAHVSLSKPMWMLRITLPILLSILIVMGLGYALHDDLTPISPSTPFVLCSVTFHPAWVAVKGGSEVLIVLFYTWAFLCALIPSVPSMSMLDPAHPYQSPTRSSIFTALRREAVIYAILMCLIIVILSSLILARVPVVASLYYYSLHLTLSSLLLTWHLDQPSLILPKPERMIDTYLEKPHEISMTMSTHSSYRSSMSTMYRPLSLLTLSSSLASPKSFFSFDRSLHG